MIVKLLTEHHFEFLSLKGGYTGSSESTHVKMPHCWKSHIELSFNNYITSLHNMIINTHINTAMNSLKTSI